MTVFLFSTSGCTYENWPRTTRCVICGTVRGQSSLPARNDEVDDDGGRHEQQQRRETPSPQGASYSKPISSTLNSIESKPGQSNFTRAWLIVGPQQRIWTAYQCLVITDQRVKDSPPFRTFNCLKKRLYVEFHLQVQCS